MSHEFLMSIPRITKIINSHNNPYPKDIFLWNNKETITLRRGRLNELLHKTVENTKEEIIELIEEEE